MAENNLTTAPPNEQTEAASRPASSAGSSEAAIVKSGSGVKRPGDRIFEFLSTASATLITVMIAAIAAFLI